MSEPGTFRTSMRGFHKGDVLEYIDSLQSLHAEETAQTQMELQEMRQQLDVEKQLSEELQTKLSAAEEESACLHKQIGEQLAINESLRMQAESAEKVQKECDALAESLRTSYDKQTALAGQLECVRHEYEDQLTALRSENQNLREQADRVIQAEKKAADLHGEAEALRQRAASYIQRAEDTAAGKAETEKQLQECREALAEQVEKAEKCLAENRRYASLIGDVGSFIMEIRSMGQQFLETSYKRSESCLDALDDAVTALEQQMTDTRSDMELARQELLDHSTSAGLRLDELSQPLEESASQLSEDSTTQEDVKSDHKDAFFR